MKPNDSGVDINVHNEGTQCSVRSCSNNYFAPVENSQSTFNGGSWSSALACQLSKTPCSGVPKPVSNADIKCFNEDKVAGGFFDGTRCQFSCISGYVTQPASSKPEVQCNNGAWKYPHTCAKGNLRRFDIKYFHNFQ